MALLQIMGVLQLEDVNGAPRAGAKAYTYQTGTTTPLTTYTDAGLTPGLEHANPIVADSTGLFPPVYVPTTTDVKVTFKTSADVTLFTVDPVPVTGAVAALSVDTTQLANDAVTNAKLANMASGTFKGRRTSGTGDPEDITSAQAAVMVGGRILLQTFTGGGTSYDFTGVNSTLYSGYIAEFENILPATDNVSFEWLASIDGGATFITTATYANASSKTNADPPIGGASITSTAPAIAQNLSNTAGEGLKGVMEITSGGATAYATQFHSQTGHINNGGGAQLTNSYGANATLSAVTAYRWRMSSGNIANGSVIRVYGIPK